MKIKKVMVFGTFDGIHKGHLDFFRQAKKHGDYLTVIVARDVNVKKIKNKLPIKNEQKRLNDLKKCDLVNEVLMGDENNPYKIIQKIKPNVICLGYDQNSFNKNLDEKLEELEIKSEIHILKPYKPNQFKSSVLKLKK